MPDNTTLTKPALHSELTDLQVKDLKRGIELDFKEDVQFADFFEKKKWPKGYTSIQTRRLVHNEPGTIANIAENIAPRSIKLSYATFSITTKNYRTKFVYTREAVQYSIDNIVADARTELGQWAISLKNQVLAACLLASKGSITAESTLVATIRKAAVVARKIGWNPTEGDKWSCLTTPEVIDALTEALSVGSTYQLPESLKEKALAGYVGDYKGFAFHSITAAADQMVHTKVASESSDFNAHYLIFIGKTAARTWPAEMYMLDGVEVIDNPLGSGILVDQDGKYTADDNKQKGSVALNVDGFVANIVDDRCILVCKFPSSGLISVGTAGEVSTENRTGYASKSSSPAA